MSRHLSIFFLFVALVLLMSCEKEAKNVKLPEADPKLVIHGFISPSDSLIIVSVNKSLPFFGDEAKSIDEEVDDATVQLTSNGKTVQLIYNSFLQRYIVLHDSNFPIVPGQKYGLFVTAPGGFNCSAETTVPLTYPQNFRITIDSSEQSSVNGFNNQKFKIISYWKDKAGVLNYYRQSINNAGFDSFDDTEVCNFLLTDVNRDGKEMSASCLMDLFSFNGPSDPFSNQDSAFLLTVDFAYYRYHDSYNRSDNDNPFSEPVQIYTNISGGLGCFGSYLKSSIALKQ